jgi:hypothetical protein
MIDIIKKKIDEMKTSSIEINIKDLKKCIIEKKLIIEEKLNIENDFNQIKKIKSKIAKIQKELSINIEF